MTAGSRSRAATVGVLAVCLGLAAAFAPWSAVPLVDPAALERALSGSTLQRLLVGSLLAATAAVAWRLRAVDRATPAPLRAGGGAEAANAADESFEAATDRGSAGAGTRVPAASAVADVPTLRRRRARLEALAVDAVAVAADVDRDVARDRVVAGEWTDDPVAADALGDETAPDPPLRWRLYAWLWEERAAERAVERVLDEVEATVPEGAP